MIIHILLILLGAFDIYEQKMPLPLLLVFLLAALWQFTLQSWWLQVFTMLSVIFMGIGCLVLKHRKALGGGDMWLLIGLMMAWPAEIFWTTMVNGLLLLSLTAIGVWIQEKDVRKGLPLTPFIILGYWVRG